VTYFGASNPACVKAPLMMLPAPAISPAGGNATDIAPASPETMPTGRITFEGGTLGV